MSNRLQTALAAAAVLALTSGAAMAGPVDTFSGTVTFTDTSPLFNNPVYFTGSFAQPVFGFTGGVGYSYTDDLTINAFDLDLRNATNTDGLKIDVAFTIPDSQTGTVTGTGTDTDKFHLFGLYYSDRATIDWTNNTQDVAFLDGSILTLSIPDITFKGIDGGAIGTDPLTMTVKKVPEPASIALFGVGLLGLGMIGFARRRSGVGIAA